ncbi:hypothetical protein OKW43_000364 [Paraburkholderia sp. WC7.3g]
MSHPARPRPLTDTSVELVRVISKGLDAHYRELDDLLAGLSEEDA